MTYEDLRSKGFPPSECHFILETIHREVAIYNKALKMACEEGTWRYNNMWQNNVEDLMNGYLQKARDE